jgi:hypothetical protein
MRVYLFFFFFKNFHSTNFEWFKSLTYIVENDRLAFYLICFICARLSDIWQEVQLAHIDLISRKQFSLLLPTTSALYISFFLLRVCVCGFFNLNVAQPASCVSSRTFFNRSGFIFCCFVLYYSTLKPSVLFSLVSCVGVHGMKECLNTHTHGTVNSGMNQIIDTKCRLSYTT